MAEKAVSGGKQIGWVLKEEGVEYIFGMQGGHIWSILVDADGRLQDEVDPIIRAG